jgi:hypothetical protein
MPAVSGRPAGTRREVAPAGRVWRIMYVAKAIACA